MLHNYYIVDPSAQRGVLRHKIIMPWLLFGIHGSDSEIYLGRRKPYEGFAHRFVDVPAFPVDFLESRSVCKLLKEITKNQGGKITIVTGEERALFINTLNNIRVDRNLSLIGYLSLREEMMIRTPELFSKLER